MFLFTEEEESGKSWEEEVFSVTKEDLRYLPGLHIASEAAVFADDDETDRHEKNLLLTEIESHITGVSPLAVQAAIESDPEAVAIFKEELYEREIRIT